MTITFARHSNSGCRQHFLTKLSGRQIGQCIWPMAPSYLFNALNS
jgi:hypothetical protein